MPEPASDPHGFTDPARGERLQRVLADAGVGSRRACEELILGGEVEVNGRLVAELPAWVDPRRDRIVIAGKVVADPERKLYVLLNKPARTLSTLKDEPGADRRTVAELVDHPAASRLFPVGRLDYDTVGLVLMTNDGDLANQLTHPRYGVPKTYLVTVRGSLDEAAVAELERGIYLAERRAGRTVGAVRTAHVEITLVHQDRQNTTLELTLREGRNRQVRRMMSAVGYPVRKLERIGMGPVRLKGVARGAWRELTRDEVWALKRAAGSPGGRADPGPDAPTSRAGVSTSRARQEAARPSGSTQPVRRPRASQPSDPKPARQPTSAPRREPGAPGRGSSASPAPKSRPGPATSRARQEAARTPKKAPSVPRAPKAGSSPSKPARQPRQPAPGARREPPPPGRGSSPGRGVSSGQAGSDGRAQSTPKAKKKPARNRALDDRPVPAKPGAKKPGAKTTGANKPGAKKPAATKPGAKKSGAPRPAGARTEERPGVRSKNNGPRRGGAGAEAGPRPGGRMSQPPAPTDSGPRIKKRTMKNAINRATKGKPDGAAPRRAEPRPGGSGRKGSGRGRAGG